MTGQLVYSEIFWRLDAVGLRDYVALSRRYGARRSIGPTNCGTSAWPRIWRIADDSPMCDQ